MPVLPPDFTGDIYRITTKPEASSHRCGFLLRGPRGLKTMIEGNSAFTNEFTPDGPQIVVVVISFSQALPQIPFTRFELSQTAPILLNPLASVRRATRRAIVTGHSGAVRDPHRRLIRPGPAAIRASRGRLRSSPSLVPAYKSCAAVTGSTPRRWLIAIV